MVIRFYLIFVLFICWVSGHGQSNIGFAERFILGSSGTYISHVNEFDRGIAYHEFHWDKKAMVNINRSFYGGIRWLSIFARGNSILYEKGRRDSYYVVGAFAEYDVIPLFQHRGFIRVGWNYGNICVCGFEDPYKEDGLHYPAIGVGAEYYFTKHLAVMAEVENLLILTRSVEPDIFFRYGIGLRMQLNVQGE